MKMKLFGNSDVLNWKDLGDPVVYIGQESDEAQYKLWEIVSVISRKFDEIIKDVNGRPIGHQVVGSLKCDFGDHIGIMYIVCQYDEVSRVRDSNRPYYYEDLFEYVADTSISEVIDVGLSLKLTKVSAYKLSIQ